MTEYKYEYEYKYENENENENEIEKLNININKKNTYEINTLNTLSKKEEIENITKELKSHYYKNEFFVDPDNKFINLIQKITVRKINK
jgi:hypothetical protein